MSFPPGSHLSQTDRSIGGVLSAVGSLLQALGGDRGDPAPRAEPAPEPPTPMLLPPSAIPPTRLRGEAPPAAQAGSTEPADEVSTMLADARARAQAILDDSMARAEELLRPAAVLPEQEHLERIETTVTEIATDVRSLHARLDAIEALVRQQAEHPAPVPPVPPTLPSPPTSSPTTFGSIPTGAATLEPPAFGSVRPFTPSPEPRPAFGSAPPSTPAPEPKPPFGSVRATLAAWTPPDAPDPEPERLEPERAVAPAPPPTPEPTPPPLLPTSWAGLSSPAPTVPPPSTPPPVAEPPATASPAAPAEPPADTFNPVAGAISLRVSPVAGFQGLMRVQDALVRIRGVREAGVEAYAQGEARLRLHLSNEMRAESLASALAELLGRPTRVTAASTSERTLQLELE